MKSFKQDIESKLNSMFPELEIDISELILKVHKELLNGNPISKKEYYSMIDLPTEKADFLLEKLGELDKQDNIVAFSGLSLTPTNHRLIVNGRTFYTWCVVDAILFTDWLNISSQVLSHDPVDNAPIELQMKGDHLLSSKPYPLYISWVDNMNACDIRGSLCNHVSFFASEATANQWLKENPNGKVLTIDDFFESGKIGIECC